MSSRAPALRTGYPGNPMHRQAVMPQQIRCIQCSRLRSQAQFSETQLARLRWAITHGTARKSAGVSLVCRSCTGSQVTELTCCVCGDTKGLNAFTKAQRRDPDHARCINCVANHQEAAPIHGDTEDKEESDDEDSISNYHEDSEFGSESAGGARLPTYDDDDLTDEMHILNVSSAGPSTKQSASSVSTKASTTQNARRPSQLSTSALEDWQKLAKGGSSSAAPGRSFVGYDAQGQAHLQSSAASTIDSDNDDEASATSVADDHDAGAERQARSRFARVLGTRGIPSAYRHEETNVRNVPLYGDPDDDDSEEVDYEDDYFTM